MPTTPSGWYSTQRAGEAHGQRDVPALGPHEAPQVPVQVVDAPDEREQFHDGGLVPGAVAEVGIERGLQLSPAREQRRTKFLQACPALGERRAARRAGKPRAAWRAGW